MLRYVVLTCLGICLGGFVFAQSGPDISGKWYGILKTPQGQKQRLVLTFANENGEWNGQLVNPDEEDDPVLTDTVAVTNDSLKFSIPRIGVVFMGAWTNRNTYNGFFYQLNNRVSIYFSRKEVKEDDLQLERPQTPKSTVAYDTEDIKFVNKVDKVLLGGTLTRPGTKGKDPFKVIILIPGAGHPDRDNEMFGHRPFAVMADYFVRRGIATLRFDQRGVGNSTGNYDSASIGNLANDVQAALAYLRSRNDIDSLGIGLLGYGEGGAVAEMVAASDKMIAYLLLLAGPGVDGQTQYLNRMATTAASYGDSREHIRDYKDYYQPYLKVLVNQKDTLSRKTIAATYLGLVYNRFGDSTDIAGKQQFIQEVYAADARPRALSLLRFDPAPYLAKIRCPVLAMNGAKDVETAANPNLKGIQDGLKAGGNEMLTMWNLPGLNHLFQNCITCRIEEYGTLDETISPKILEGMTKWVQKLYEDESGK
ncbi:alpha/beta hydrolase family protein [Chitinophaga sancti]|uniref:alpha/beta hydrolase family protein n=1 Tax=Chitinophaga sancti TaxID=1004 RepID=UPI003F79C9E4